MSKLAEDLKEALAAILAVLVALYDVLCFVWWSRLFLHRCGNCVWYQEALSRCQARRMTTTEYNYCRDWVEEGPA
jgi:hypothetical protein